MNLFCFYHEFTDNSKILATKEDIALVRINAAKDKSEMIKWMLWLGQVTVTLGFIFLFLRK